MCNSGEVQLRARGRPSTLAFAPSVNAAERSCAHGQGIHDVSACLAPVVTDCRRSGCADAGVPWKARRLPESREDAMHIMNAMVAAVNAYQYYQRDVERSYHEIEASMSANKTHTHNQAADVQVCPPAPSFLCPGIGCGSSSEGCPQTACPAAPGSHECHVPGCPDQSPPPATFT